MADSMIPSKVKSASGPVTLGKKPMGNNDAPRAMNPPVEGFGGGKSTLGVAATAGKAPVAAGTDKAAGFGSSLIPGKIK